MNLRIPGPTPCPDDVLEAVGGQMMNHRGPEFAGIVRRVTEGLNWVFGVSSEVLTLSASGTGGLEAAVVNTLSPGDRVLAVSIGVFGNRLASIAETYGAEVVRYELEWGAAADSEEVARRLDADPSIKAVLVTHNETSTGVTNPLEAIGAVVRDRDPLLIVDGVSSVSSIPCPAERWGVDVLVSGSQKGWMVPPGLAFVWLSEAAWEASERSTMPRFYFDLQRARSSLESQQTPWTPAISVFYGLDKAFESLRAEGLEGIYVRHHAVAQYTRDRVRAMGLQLFAQDERRASDTVTAVRWPDDVDGPAIARRAREEFRRRPRRRPADAQGQDLPRRPHGLLLPGRHRRRPRRGRAPPRRNPRQSPGLGSVIPTAGSGRLRSLRIALV